MVSGLSFFQLAVYVYCSPDPSLCPFLLPRISRAENKPSTDFHFFTSHFYTTLADEGPGAVESWTAKKNIDIFKKKLIFIPINKDLHWSLCVVVNPGAIRFSSNKNRTKNDPLSCLIFLDSLNMHRKAKVQSNISKWLNSEWERLRKKSECQNPFTKKAFRIFSPTGKFSNDSFPFFILRHFLTNNSSS
jgi:Ulp1 family protease